MALWRAWFRCVHELRGACARRRTFLWMSLVLAGLSIRADLAGVSSLVRALGLEAKCYRRLLHVFHNPGLSLDKLTETWNGLVLRLFTPHRLDNRLVLIGDGLKVGKKMPAVKKLHQCSENNSKPAYIFGHSFQALGLLSCGPAGHLCCVPLTSRIHEGLVFSNRDRRTLLDKFVQLFLGVVGTLDTPPLLVVDAYYACRKVLRALLNTGHDVITRVKVNAVAYYPAVQPETHRRGRPRSYGEKVRLSDLWCARATQFIEAPSPV